MQFTFKRDEEGRERIYVGDVCVAQFYDSKVHKEWEFVQCDTPTMESMRMESIIDDAIERADEAGFWDTRPPERLPLGFQGVWWEHHEVAVDVPVADNAVLSVTVGGDES